MAARLIGRTRHGHAGTCGMGGRRHESFIRYGIASAENACPENTAVLQPTTPAPSTAPAGATMAFSDAIGSIVSARCEREQRCNHIGSGKRYESVQACRTALRSDIADDLNPAECSRGINRRELSECMQQVREEDSGNPIETLERVVACRTSDLCRDTSVSLR